MKKTLYDRLTRDFAEQGAHSVQGALAKLLPNSMRPVAVEKWGVDPATRAAQITKEQKQALVQLCKHWQVPVTALGDKEHAVVCRRRRGREGSGPQDHGQQAVRRAVLCRRGAGRGRPHRRVQFADRLVHRAGSGKGDVRCGVEDAAPAKLP